MGGPVTAPPPAEQWVRAGEAGATRVRGGEPGGSCRGVGLAPTQDAHLPFPIWFRISPTRPVRTVLGPARGQRDREGPSLKPSKSPLALRPGLQTPSLKCFKTWTVFYFFTERRSLC